VDDTNPLFPITGAVKVDPGRAQIYRIHRERLAAVEADMIKRSGQTGLITIACTDGQPRSNEHLIFYLKERRESVSYTHVQSADRLGSRMLPVS
jgi:hypothetical protein